ISPDGKTLAIIGRQIELWSTASWQLKRCAEGCTGDWAMGNEVAFSPDGKRFAILLADGSVDWRDGTTGARIELLKGYAKGYTIRCPGKDKAIVLGGEDKVYRAWAVPSGELLTLDAGHLEEISQVAFAPDGKHLLSISKDGVLIRWEVAKGRPEPGGGLTPGDYAGWVGAGKLL